MSGAPEQHLGLRFVDTCVHIQQIDFSIGLLGIITGVLVIAKSPNRRKNPLPAVEPSGLTMIASWHLLSRALRRRTPSQRA